MTVIIHTDGGSRNNPGDAGLGVHIARSGTVLAEISEYLGKQTNNYAEYMAVIRALEWCLDHRLTDRPISLYMDSKLVVEQVSGRWKVKEPTLRPLVARVRELAAAFPEIMFAHVPRAHNKDADRLANEAMDRKQLGVVIH